MNTPKEESKCGRTMQLGYCQNSIPCLLHSPDNKNEFSCLCGRPSKKSMLCGSKDCKYELVQERAVPSNISEEWTEKYKNVFYADDVNWSINADGSVLYLIPGQLWAKVESFIKSEKQTSFNEGRSGELSELIRQCGDKFKHLSVLRSGKWEAIAAIETQGYDGYGSTPEEAVRNLLTSLNKK